MTEGRNKWLGRCCQHVQDVFIFPDPWCFETVLQSIFLIILA